MVLHELITNALKYGALSRPDGVVHLGWCATGEDQNRSLQLDWREEKGPPPPVSPPAHHGFGMTMIESSAKNCGGKAELRFEPDGLKAKIVTPVCDNQCD